jgi:hypothetical protein
LSDPLNFQDREFPSPCAVREAQGIREAGGQKWQMRGMVSLVTFLSTQETKVCRVSPAQSEQGTDELR